MIISSLWSTQTNTGCESQPVLVCDADNLLTVFACEQAEVEEADGVVAVDIDSAEIGAVLVVFTREQAEVEEADRTVLVDVRSEVDTRTVCTITLRCACCVLGQDHSVDNDTIGVTDKLERVVARGEVDIDEATGRCLSDPVGDIVRKVGSSATCVGRYGATADGITGRAINIEQIGVS